MGADSARLATTMTMGRRMPDAANRTSFMRARPCEAVAVKTRDPAALPPTHADNAENSESTSMCFDFSLPCAISFPRFSTMWVCGVIGYATTMSGSQSAAAFAVARLPSITVFVMVSLFFYFFRYCFYGAFVHAD